MSNIKRQLKIIFLSLIAVATFSGCDLFSNQLLNQTVISVSDYKMTTHDFSKALAAKLKNLDALSAKDPKIISLFKEKILSDFIVESFLILYFEEKNLVLTQLDVETEIKKISTGYPDDASFRESLSEEGITYAQWKNKIELSLKRKKIFELLNAQSEIPKDSELESYYQSNKNKFLLKEAVSASHIVVADENQAEIVLKLAKHQKFVDLVKKYSMASDVALNGNMGWLEREAMPIEFDKMYKSKIGEVIGPFKLSDGYHILKIEQKRTAKTKLYAECKDQVKNEVLALRETARFSAWLDEQIKKYKVYKNTSVLDALYVETR